jgi:hypothetical protein
MIRVLRKKRKNRIRSFVPGAAGSKGRGSRRVGEMSECWNLKDQQQGSFL